MKLYTFGIESGSESDTVIPVGQECGVLNSKQYSTVATLNIDPKLINSKSAGQI